MIEVRCFQSFADLVFLREEINALNLTSEQPDPFSTLDFYENYLRHDQLLSEPGGFRLCFLAGFVDGRLVGYLPLKRTCQRIFGLRVTKLTFFAVHDVDRPHLIARSGYAMAVVRAFYDYLFESTGRWGMLEFQQQATGSPLLEFGSKPASNDYRIRHWPGWTSWSIPIRWGSLQAYFMALSKKFRSNVSRQMRSLSAAGTLELIASSDPASTPALLELYIGIESFSWKAQAGLNVGRDAARVAYFQGLLASGRAMRISILLLLLDGAPIAGLINGAYGEGLYALQTVFDDRLSRLSPGSAILLMGMRDAISGGFRFFNLLSGFDYFKNRWLAEATDTQCTQIYRVRSPLFWKRALGDWVRQFLVRARIQAPMLFNPIRRASAAPASATIEPAASVEIRRTEEEKIRIATLISAARCGQCHFLSAADLAAAMPFDMAR